MDIEFLEERIKSVPEVSDADYKKDEKFFNKIFHIAGKQNRGWDLEMIIAKWREELEFRRADDSKDSIYNPLAYLTTMIKESFDLSKGTGLVAMEGNLIDLPYYRHGKRTSEPILFEHIRKNKNKSEMKTLWKIETSALIPNQEDALVMRALIKMWKDKGMNEDGTVYFTRYELCKLLKWDTSGKTYNKISNAIDYFKKTTITSVNAFLNFETGKFVNTDTEKEALNIIDYYRFRDPGKVVAGPNYLAMVSVKSI